jgi:LDH2 family malate/lactate/ureidoglycolate dehydrogenase
MSPTLLTHQALAGFAQELFAACGMNEANTAIASRVLLAADLRGIDSHGVARLPGYVKLFESGRAKPNPDWKIIHETPSTATVDADTGLGLVVAPQAMEIAIQKARTAGTGWVAIQNSNHFGIAAYHAMLALPHDMIGIAMTNASPLVAPTFSTERMLGTNPICFAFPAGTHPPVVIDMATSAAANGKLEIAQRTGKKIPAGWVADKAGNPSVDTDILRSGGALLPLGSSSEAGHKGYALAAAVDIFSGVLSGAGYGPWVPPFVSFLAPLENMPGKGIGHFVGAMRIDAFRKSSEFREHMDNWISRFKSAQRLDPDQEVLVPGEPEARSSDERNKNGIPLEAKVMLDLKNLAIKFNLKF